MNIDDFKPMTVYTIYIASTPEKVWEALTRSEFSRKYFFGNSVEIDLRVGGAYIVRTPEGALHISGEVIECVAPRKLTVTFNVNWPELIEKLGPTLVTYEIEEAGEAVEPQKPARNRTGAHHQDGAAATDAGGVEKNRHRDAVRYSCHTRRSGTRVLASTRNPAN